MKNILNMTLEEIYLDWVNNYLTVRKMANDYGINRVELERLLIAAKEIREQIIEQNRNAHQK